MPKKLKKTTKEKPDLSALLAAMDDMDGVSEVNNDIKYYSTGDYSLDHALYGGIPEGQFLEVRGPAGCGKSLMALQLARECVKSGGFVLYFDTEAKIAPVAWHAFGLDKTPLCKSYNVKNLEQMLKTARAFVESGQCRMIVVDSVDSLETNEMDERDINEGSKVGGYKAKIFSEWLGGLKQLAAINNTTVIFIRQLRSNPNAMFSNPETVSGGKALEYYSTIRMVIRADKDGNEIKDNRLVYQGAKIKIDKMNNGALPVDYIPVRFYIGDGEWGLDRIQSAFEEGKRLRILAPRTASSPKYIPCAELLKRLGITDPDVLSFNGRGKVMDALKSDEALLDAVCELIEETDNKPYARYDEVDGEAPEDDSAMDFEEFDEDEE